MKVLAGCRRKPGFVKNLPGAGPGSGLDGGRCSASPSLLPSCAVEPGRTWVAAGPTFTCGCAVPGSLGPLRSIPDPTRDLGGLDPWGWSWGARAGWGQPVELNCKVGLEAAPPQHLPLPGHLGSGSWLGLVDITE